MLEWKPTTFGNGCTASLGHGLTLSVNYEGMERLPADAPMWNVIVFGSRLKTRSPSKEEARARAIVLARKWLSDAAKALEEVGAGAPDSKGDGNG